MDKKRVEVHKTKNIYIGYMTTINPESLTIENIFEKDVAAFKKVKNTKGLPIYIPLNQKPKYYTDIELVEISKFVKREGIVTLGTIEKIVEQEREKQLQNEYSKEMLQNAKDSKQDKAQNIDLINRELDINKTKKLVA